MKHCGTQQIETKRLLLRQFTEDDSEAMYKNWASDPEVTRYLTWPHHASIETTKTVLNNWINQYDKKDFYLWAIVLKETKEPIGSISVVRSSDETDMIEIGYCIGKSWWHQGYTSEALQALIREFFTKVQVNRIQAIHDINNPNSGKVMAKCGMHYEGTLRQYAHNNTGLCDVCLYAILKQDYH